MTKVTNAERPVIGEIGLAGGVKSPYCPNSSLVYVLAAISNVARERTHMTINDALMAFPGRSTPRG
jgi:hypothetical protein